ncbi:uncharacterized protein DS421_15g497870 [Arachis hypogaea]|nr:uncharacterized protein DS421_15g497870 [Arachis hypogaea]
MKIRSRRNRSHQSLVAAALSGLVLPSFFLPFAVRRRLAATKSATSPFPEHVIVPCATSRDSKLKTTNLKTLLSIPPLFALHLPNLLQLTSLLLPLSIPNPIPNLHHPISQNCRPPPSIYGMRMNSKASPSNTPPPITMLPTPIPLPLPPIPTPSLLGILFLSQL